MTFTIYPILGSFSVDDHYHILIILISAHLKGSPKMGPQPLEVGMRILGNLAKPPKAQIITEHAQWLILIY